MMVYLSLVHLTLFHSFYKRGCTLLTLAIIGCINWGLIGFFGFDLVSFIFGDMTWLSRIIYALVGLSGIYMLTFYGRIKSNMIE